MVQSKFMKNTVKNNLNIEKKMCRFYIFLSYLVCRYNCSKIRQYLIEKNNKTSGNFHQIVNYCFTPRIRKLFFSVTLEQK